MLFLLNGTRPTQNVCCSPPLEQSAVVMSYVTKDSKGFDYISYSAASLSSCYVKLNSAAETAELCYVSVQINKIFVGLFVVLNMT